MTEPDLSELLTAYDVQLRRAPALPSAGWQIERVDAPAPLLRMTAPAVASWGDGVVWSDLDEATADAAIADTIAYYRGLGRSFEWKHHGYDRPTDLPDRLRAAGLVPDPEETVVAGRVDEVVARLADAPAPEDITLRPLRADPAGRAADWAGIRELHERVWVRDADASGLVREVSAEHAADPAAMSVHLALAEDGTVVCAGWTRFHVGTDFASLWGGSTLPAYRRRGIYRSLVARRAGEAAERGFRYLQVDASSESLPILERLGLRRLTSTTPFMWHPEP